MTTLTVEDTTRSYSGKPGCMCGCNGDYKESTRARKLAITQLLKNPNVGLQDFGKTQSDGARGCLYVQTDTRNRVLYLTEQGVVKAKKLVDVAAD